MVVGDWRAIGGLVVGGYKSAAEESNRPRQYFQSYPTVGWIPKCVMPASLASVSPLHFVPGYVPWIRMEHPCSPCLIRKCKQNICSMAMDGLQK